MTPAEIIAMFAAGPRGSVGLRKRRSADHSRNFADNADWILMRAQRPFLA